MPKVSQTSKKKMSDDQNLTKITCLNCGCHNQLSFYKSHNPFNKQIPFIPYCKECIKTDMWNYFLVKYNKNEQLALHALLRSLNLPYIHSIYLASIKTITNPNSKISLNDDTDNSVLISAYMKNYNSLYDRNGYGDTYIDSDGLGEINGLNIYEDNIKIKRPKKQENIEDIDTEKYEVIEYDADELLFKWGDFDDEKLINLEREYLDWADKLGDYINEKSTDLMVKQVCLQTVEIQEKRLRGEKVKDEIATLQGLLNTSGLVEKTRNKDMESTKIGMTIREIENRRPLKSVEENLKDVDKYGDLLNAFAGAMSRTLGKENQFTKEFDKYFEGYTIDLLENAQDSSNEQEDGSNV